MMPDTTMYGGKIFILGISDQCPRSGSKIKTAFIQTTAKTKVMMFRGNASPLETWSANIRGKMYAVPTSEKAIKLTCLSKVKPGDLSLKIQFVVIKNRAKRNRNQPILFATG